MCIYAIKKNIKKYNLTCPLLNGTPTSPMLQTLFSSVGIFVEKYYIEN